MPNQNHQSCVMLRAFESGERFKHILAATYVLLILAGCATPYQPLNVNSSRGGYADARVDDSTYIVTYRGDAMTDAERTWSLWMYRCAELTLEKGFAYFSIAPATRVSNDAAKPSMRPALAYAGDAGEFIQTKGGGVTYYTYSIPYVYTITSASARISLYRDPLPSSVLIAINAAKLKEQLAPVIAGKPRELSRRALLASVAVFNDKVQLAELESIGGSPIVINNLEEMRVIATRDFVPALLKGEVAANTAPIARKFAAPKRRIVEMTTSIEQEFKSGGDNKREPATVVEQYIHHPEGYTTITSQTTRATSAAPTGFKIDLSIGGMVSIRSAYTLSPPFTKSANSLRYGSQYVVQAMSGEFARPTAKIGFTTRSLVDPSGVEKRFSSDSLIVTTSCDVSETKPASQLHPKLQGNAIQMKCTSTIGGRPGSDSTKWFLEDYQWYVRESEKWATGSSIRMIKDVSFDPAP
jgi:hypothetical protein